ncbi:hypothetical protein MJO28_007214, partial [Puccinia striiformis f. sp. tritici]
MQATATIPMSQPLTPTMCRMQMTSWQCQSPDHHMLCNCPMCQRPNFGRQPTPSFHQQRGLGKQMLNCGRYANEDSGASHHLCEKKWIFPCPIVNSAHTAPSFSHVTSPVSPRPAVYPFLTNERLNLKNNFYVPIDTPKEVVTDNEKDLTANEKTLMYWHRCVMANCDDSKGWIFWIKDSNKLMASEVVKWKKKQSPIPHHHPLKTPDGPVKTHPIVNDNTNKHKLDFITNQLTLGDHSADVQIRDQGLLVDTMLRECLMFALTAPQTYKQVQKSSQWNKWKEAIEEELGDLFQMK